MCRVPPTTGVPLLLMFSAARLLAGALLAGALAEAAEVAGALPLELPLAVVAGLELAAVCFFELLLHAATTSATTATPAAT
ncbi:MAG TPA: hypothetical protein VK662_15985, partial [Acidothermaceae bacterium]|nr:hypothetical protein [Acidothermaceae bacterium]